MSKTKNKIIIEPVYPTMETIEPWVNAIRMSEEQYDTSLQDYSPSQMMDSPRVIQLMKRHAESIKMPTFNHIGSFMGTGIHTQFEEMWKAHNEKVGRVKYRTEERMFIKVAGRKIGGCFDMLDVDGPDLWDIKTTSTSSVLRTYLQSTIDKWAKQQNCYSYMLKETEGLEVRSANILCLFVDWKLYLLKRDKSKGYPKERVMHFKLPLWPHSKTKKYLEDRVNLLKKHEKTPDNKLPLCSDKDRWSNSVYKVYHTRNPKRALFAKAVTEQEAKDFIKTHKYNHNSSDFDPDGYSIKFTKGKQTRCSQWCQVAPVCNQWQQMLKEGYGDLRW